MVRTKATLSDEYVNATRVNDFGTAIELAKHYSSMFSIRTQNHLNTQGKYTTCNLDQVITMNAEMKNLYRYLCSLAHSVANEKTFEIEYDGRKYKMTPEEVKNG
jgi:hypothetical protein